MIAILVLEAVLGLLVYTIPQLRQSREEAAAAAAGAGTLSPSSSSSSSWTNLWGILHTHKQPILPVPQRLWRLVAMIALASYTATILTDATGFNDKVYGPRDIQTIREQTQRFLAGVLLGVPYFYISAVVLGAPLKEMGDRTLAWAWMMSLLVAGPLAAAAPSLRELRLPPLWKGPPREGLLLRCRALGCCLGAWLGAMVVPLDWGMPFQEWPLPLVVGAVMGHNLGTVAKFCVRQWPLTPRKRVRFHAE